MPLLVIPDRVKNLVGRLCEGERSELSWKGVVGRAVEGVELGGEEPGEGGEHKVEHVLPNVHHDVVVQPKPIGNGFPVLKTIVIIDTKAMITRLYIKGKPTHFHQLIQSKGSSCLAAAVLAAEAAATRRRIRKIILILFQLLVNVVLARECSRV